MIVTFFSAKCACVGGAPLLSTSTHPRKFGNHVTVHRPTAPRPSAPQENQCLLWHFKLVWEPKRKLIAQAAHQCCDQLTAIKTGLPLTSITWPYRGLKCRPIEVEYFFKVIRWQITSFKWSQAQVYFFQGFISNMLCLCHYGTALLGFWFQTDLGSENSSSFILKYRRGRPYLTMVTRWSRSTSNFYTLIGQNLTGEFMGKNYAASWK